jgi:hypothetical protein
MTTTSAPAPLTPPDCDLRGLPYMPLDVIRLLDSDMFAEATGDEFKAAVSLWCKSWTQVPAASLPNKDAVLAHLSGNAAKWKRIKAGAMRGWILCSDDRWYHPVVAEKALAALPGREEFNQKKSADAERKAREREDRKALFELLKRHGVTPDWNVSTKALRGLAAQYLSQEPPPPVTDDERDMSHGVTVSKGEKKGEGELTSKTQESSSQPPTPDAQDGDDDSLTPPLPTNRNVQIALLLRAQGVQATSQNPIVCVTWAKNPKVTDEVLNVAITKAKAAKGDKPVPLLYLAPIVEQELEAQDAPPPAPGAQKSRESWEWKRTPGGIEAKGRELGMFARGTENHQDFAKRIEAELEKRKGRAA